jgi:hypothetical protein
VNFQVKGQDPLDAGAAVFSNFVGISRVGGDVQFEFIFLDINQLAILVEAQKAAPSEVPPLLTGKTVAKVVMPAEAFLQLKEHINGLMSAIEGLLAHSLEAKDERNVIGSG